VLLQIKKKVNILNNFSKLNVILFAQLNIFNEFKLICKYLYTNVLYPKFVWTNLQLYISVYAI